MSEFKPHPLLGLAIGDALGLFAEMKPFFAPEITSWGGGYLRSDHCNTVIGEGSDDTGMALALARSLIYNKGFLADQVMNAYLEWYITENPKGVGGTIREALERYRKTRDILTSGVEGSQGNGTAMRVLPLGIWYKDLTCIVLSASRDAVLTHRSAEAMDASVFLAVLAGTLLNTQFEIRQAILLSLNFLGKESVIAKKVRKTLQYCESPGAKNYGVLFVVLACGFGLGGVVETVCTVVACLLLTDTYQDAVELAVRVGGDTDTRAAIVGGLAAIRRPIPERYLSNLKDIELILQAEQQLLQGNG